MSAVLPIRLSTAEKKKALNLARKRGMPLATYIKQLLAREAALSSSPSFDIGGKAPKIPARGFSRGMAYEK